METLASYLTTSRSNWKLIALGLIASGGLSLGRQLLGLAVQEAKKRSVVQASVEEHSDIYDWLTAWLVRHPSVARCRQVQLTTMHNPAPADEEDGGDDNPSGRTVNYFPAPGSHVLHFQGTWVIVTVEKETYMSHGDRETVMRLHLTLFTRDRLVLNRLVEEARGVFEEKMRTRISIYSLSDGRHPYWQRTGSRPIRPPTSIVLDHGQFEEIFGDCRDFLAQEKWYAARGIPYRRGYLLHGPPGSGKTSLVTCIAGQLGLPIYVLTLTSQYLTDNSLRELMNSAAKRCIMLLEDVDAAFSQRTAGKVSKKLTFSGLLNALDGVAAQEGRMLFLTTNHPDRLSRALIRPGRVDFTLKFHYATLTQIRNLFLAFYNTDRGTADHVLSPAPSGMAAQAGAKLKAPGHGTGRGALKPGSTSPFARSSVALADDSPDGDSKPQGNDKKGAGSNGGSNDDMKDAMEDNMDEDEDEDDLDEGSESDDESRSSDEDESDDYDDDDDDDSSRRRRRRRR